MAEQTVMHKTGTSRAAEEISEILQKAFQGGKSLGSRLKFDYGADGQVFIDGLQNPNQVSVCDREADCTVFVKAKNHLRIIRLELDLNTSFRRGDMRIQGDIAVAVRFIQIITAYTSEQGIS